MRKYVVGLGGVCKELTVMEFTAGSFECFDSSRFCVRFDFPSIC